MSTESIKVKYEYGYDAGKYEVIRNTIKYGVIGLAIGSIIRLSMHFFGSSNKTQPI